MALQSRHELAAYLGPAAAKPAEQQPLLLLPLLHPVLAGSAGSAPYKLPMWRMARQSWDIGTLLEGLQRIEPK